ncbi:hypothetical protein EHS13_28775 [Paenibacillus psychroresistens]|uniref:Uncharacterized protein n=1 Tax=Paenibacillus psychroresistens TaxID=1778678 RepID=A0A6B8RQD5_9BACL|nr:hypothetical protein [Paenibacillus psychroresistens]QGQ98591.1 hypothetical protein EHS13_28775 [Paenibacillus psychroresistens]
MLNKDLTGTKKLLEVVLWPVLKSFDGLTLEYEVVSTTGVRIFIDVFYLPLEFAFESEGFVSHGDNITRDRFSFERMRVRTMAICRYLYIPFTWDELDKKAEACRRAFYELLGRYSRLSGGSYSELSLFEREVMRYALQLNRPIRLGDACHCLQSGPEFSRRILRQLMEKKLLKPITDNTHRNHSYVLEDIAREYLI